MSFHWVTASTVYWTNTWNTYDYSTWDKWIVVSEVWNSPIASISQINTIKECNDMWESYHLIRDTEWMTIARNIEEYWKNWSSWVRGNWHLYNWISNDTTLWCDWTNPLAEPTQGDTVYATTTWHDICGWRNKLVLSNWGEIWDFSWNVWENVNKINSKDLSNHNYLQVSLTWASNWTSWDDDGLYSTLDMDRYGSKFYYWMDNGAWNIIAADWVTNNIFLRWSSASSLFHAGIFGLHLDWRATNSSPTVGFRCAY